MKKVNLDDSGKVFDLFIFFAPYQVSTERLKY